MLLYLLFLAFMGVPFHEAQAKSCKKELPKEVLKYFGDSDPSIVECDDYDYVLVDLNEDGTQEILAHKRQFSCSSKGSCDNEVFKKTGDRYANVGTLAGRYEVQKTKTEEFLDIGVWTADNQLVTYKWNGYQYKPENFSPGKKGTPTPTPTPNDPWNSLP